MATKPLAQTTSEEVVVSLECRNLSDHIHGIRSQVQTYLKPVAPGCTFTVDRKGARLVIRGASRTQVDDAVREGLAHFRSSRGVHVTYTVETLATVGTPGETPTEPEPATEKSSDHQWQKAMEKLRLDHEAEKALLLQRIEELEGKQRAAKGSVEPILRQKDEFERKARDAELRAKGLEEAERSRRDSLATTAARAVYESVDATRPALQEAENRLRSLTPAEDGIDGVKRAVQRERAGLMEVINSLPKIVQELLRTKNLARPDADVSDIAKAMDDLISKPSQEREQAYEEAKGILALLEEVRTGARRLPAAVLATLDEAGARRTKDEYDAKQRQGGEFQAAKQRITSFADVQKHFAGFRQFVAEKNVRIPIVFIGTNGTGDYTLRLQVPEPAPNSVLVAGVLPAIRAALKRTGEKWKEEPSDGLVTFVCQPGKGRMRDVAKAASDAIADLKENWPDQPLSATGVGLRVLLFAEGTA